MKTYLLFLLQLLLVSFSSSAQNLSKVEAANRSAAELVKHKEAHKAQATANWEQKQITSGNYKLKFEYRIIGDKPADGRSLYISLHGGGNTSPAANDQQWKNQINLYQPKEGVYLAPRAPTNTWNLWHEDHIDGMFAELIKDAIINADVNPNKVYLLGYSAGGDGLFQLAPRMADYWAAASMMAGHPGDASALSLRNLPFAIYMGGADAAYKRNELAGVWKLKLDSLEKQNPGNYIHDVHIYEGLPHWMSRRDTIAIPWMASFKRNAQPAKVAWHQDDRHHDMFYWLGVPKAEAKTGTEAVVGLAKNTITVEKNDNATLYIYLNDQLANLDKKIKVVQNGKTLFNSKVNRKAALITKTADRLDPQLIYSARLAIRNGKVTEE
ncbi:MAG: alpha/beta hydrolase [Pedobacter sp.]|nr:MAG: alpha/beta hydrolase [Pedobacter sp.]